VLHDVINRSKSDVSAKQNHWYLVRSVVAWQDGLFSVYKGPLQHILPGSKINAIGFDDSGHFLRCDNYST